MSSLRRFWGLTTVRAVQTLFAVGATTLAGTLSLVSTAVAAKEKPVVLQSFPVGKYTFDLVIAPCRSQECPVQVSLRHGAKIEDRFTLMVNAHSQRAQRETVDASWGADAGSKAWATGVEASYVSTLGRTVNLAPATTGLLVTQNFGFEHRKRGHVLLLPGGGKLVAAWSYQESSGPTWSATEVVPNSGSGRQEIVVLRGFREPAEDMPERLDAVHLVAEGSAPAVREVPLPDSQHPLYLVNAGSYASAVAARRARLDNGYCLGGYWVLDGARLPGIARGNVILGDINATRAAADTEARETHECLSSASPTVIELTQAR